MSVPRSDVRLTIGRIVLEGTGFGPAQATVFRAALHRELTVLLRRNGAWTGGAVPYAAAPPIALTASPEPASLARSMAHSIFRSLAPDARPGSP